MRPPLTYHRRYEAGMPETSSAGAATVTLVSPRTITGSSTTARGSTAAPTTRRETFRQGRTATGLAATGGPLLGRSASERTGDESLQPLGRGGHPPAGPDRFPLRGVSHPFGAAKPSSRGRPRQHARAQGPAVPQQDEHEERLEPLRGEEPDLGGGVEDRPRDHQHHGEDQPVGDHEGERGKQRAAPPAEQPLTR